MKALSERFFVFGLNLPRTPKEVEASKAYGETHALACLSRSMRKFDTLGTIYAK
jgi:hypothetical protein